MQVALSSQGLEVLRSQSQLLRNLQMELRGISKQLTMATFDRGVDSLVLKDQVGRMHSRLNTNRDVSCPDELRRLVAKHLAMHRFGHRDSWLTMCHLRDHFRDPFL